MRIQQWSVAQENMYTVYIYMYICVYIYMHNHVYPYQL